jgi:hypothetical protein
LEKTDIWKKQTFGKNRHIYMNKIENISSPNQLEPVLALINHVGKLGSEWYEVVRTLEEGLLKV